MRCIRPAVMAAAVLSVAGLGAGCQRGDDAHPEGRKDAVSDTRASDRASTGAAGTTGTQPMSSTGAIGTDGGGGPGEAMMGQRADGGTMMSGAETTGVGQDGGMPDAGR